MDFVKIGFFIFVRISTNICHILTKFLHNFELYFELTQNLIKKTKLMQDQQLKIHFSKKILEWKKSIMRSKKIICKICLKKFTFDNLDLMQKHSTNCKELAELNQTLGQLGKKLKKCKTECEILKRKLLLDTKTDK